MFARKSTSQLFCSIFRSQCLLSTPHHTSLSQWLQIRCYFLSLKLRHKSQNPFLLNFQYIGGGYQAHNMKVLELNKCLRRTCPQKMRGAGERRASCQLSSGHLCQLYLRTWENRGIPVWTILAMKTGGYLLRHLSQTAFPAFPRGLTRSHQSCKYSILVYRT